MDRGRLLLWFQIRFSNFFQSINLTSKFNLHYDFWSLILAEIIAAVKMESWFLIFKPFRLDAYFYACVHSIMVVSTKSGSSMLSSNSRILSWIKMSLFWTRNTDHVIKTVIHNYSWINSNTPVLLLKILIFLFRIRLQENITLMTCSKYISLCYFYKCLAFKNSDKCCLIHCQFKTEIIYFFLFCSEQGVRQKKDNHI